jgi:hypothetical protein
MTDRERFVADLKKLAENFYNDSLSAYHQMTDSSGGGRMFYDGQSSAFDSAQQRVEALVEAYSE